MKELSIEQKAKAYDNIIEKANKMHSENCEACQMCIEELIPELKESEDERIRKELLEHCKNQAEPYIQTGNECPQIQSWIAWLEKQGEQKAVVIPKFRVGDVVENIFTHDQRHITSIKDGSYITDNVGFIGFYDQDDWVLAEQKPAEISNICEFSIKTWIDIVDYVLKEHNGIGNYLIDPEVKDTAEKLQKRYKFDAASEEWDRVYRKGLDAGVNKGRAEALREKNPAWSEEDENHVKSILSTIECCKAQFPNAQAVVEAYSADIEWLKFLKDRVLPQQKQ